MKRPLFQHVLWLAGCLLVGLAHAQATPEYRVKAGFLYNFIVFTEWPARVGSPLPVCVYGGNPFGDELAALEGKAVSGRTLTVRPAVTLADLKSCRVVFVANNVINSLPRVLEAVRAEPVLVVTDSLGALDVGAGINMTLRQGRIVFEVNLAAARRAELELSSKLLRLASEVRQ